MPRVKIELPATFSFTTTIPVRITDLNYGSHVGNDAILGIIHEARMQFLAHYGYTELNLDGAGLIMADVVIEFKKEAFYGDVIRASVTAADFQKIRFNLFYKLEKETDGKWVPVAHACTGMVCYNYQQKKVAAVPQTVIDKLSRDSSDK